MLYGCQVNFNRTELLIDPPLLPLSHYKQMFLDQSELLGAKSIWWNLVSTQVFKFRLCGTAFTAWRKSEAAGPLFWTY